ncbi:hypothetical protein [Kineosporia babensis]|uniref:Lipoprotein n=1 Tax=Kineosporia babensis TaxID=499548 RepID=A0A9X1NG24_9ACTN|nr:hypothetical protein [Kineosporia babensis]MCD5313260.1 hypothetical protein [Kineosporia babensis]
MRRSRGGALISLGVAAALTAACSSPFGGDSAAGDALPSAQTTESAEAGSPRLGDAFTKQDVAAMYQAEKGMRLKLPVALPEGYEFVGFLPPDRQGKQIIARNAWFRLGHENVTVCSELVRFGAGICPETNIDVRKRERGQLQQVSVEVPVLIDTEAWGEVEYSADPDDWEWMP